MDDKDNESPLLEELMARPGYADAALKIIAQIQPSATPLDALDLLYSLVSTLGAQQAVFVSFIRDDVAHENYRFLLAADPAWCYEYQSKAWYGSDPWLMYASSNNDAICASEIELATRQQAEVQALAERHGMRSVCVAPAPSARSHSRMGMLALGSTQSGFFETSSFGVFKLLAKAAAYEFHEWWCRYERQELVDNLRITEEDLELLRRELDGATTKRTATQLGTSSASVNSRWQRLNRKLGSPQRGQTARLAAQLGLI